MADLPPVNSPRRVLSLSRQRRGAGSFLDVEDKASGIGLSGQRGPKPAEVYGFVGSITTVVATVTFFIWAYLPEKWLHSIGIFYYPSRYWAIALPTYCMVIIVLTLAFYIGLNFMATPPPTSLNAIFGELSILEKSLNPGADSVGIRVPDNDFIRIIARGSGSALALTSANLSGYLSSVSINDFENLWEHCAYVYDGGTLPRGRAGSTIVDLTSSGKYRIIRPGSAREETVAILERHFLREEEADTT